MEDKQKTLGQIAYEASSKFLSGEYHETHRDFSDLLPGEVGHWEAAAKAVAEECAMPKKVITDEMVAAMRREFVDSIQDYNNPQWGTHRPDYLKDVCRNAGYPDPDKAADFFCRSAISAVLNVMHSAPIAKACGENLGDDVELTIDDFTARMITR